MNLKHFDHEGRARFITFCTNRRLPILTNDVFRQVVHEEIFAFCRESRTRLLSYVIMPEHVHVVIVPPEQLQVGPAIGSLKRSIAKRIVASLRTTDSELIRTLEVKRSGEVRVAFWLKRCFDHNCRTEESVWRCVNYCHWNPVTRGLVAVPERWRWSSYSYYLDVPDNLIEIDVLAQASACFPTETKND
jgi:putative transposase